MAIPGRELPPQPEERLSEDRRREIFAALVESQDRDIPVPQSRREVAQRFGVTEAEVWQIEREGLDNNWPPL
jgi:hypothetical protein